VTVDKKGRSVLLVGSVPLSSAKEVFEVVGSELGGFIKRIPDGETGPRSLWIVCQGEPMKNAQGLEVGGERQLQGGIRNPRYKIKEGMKPEDVKFGRLGYADNALESYKIFKRLQDLGTIPADVRFQVCIPTPLAVVFAFFIASEVRRIWPFYERRLLEELDEITRAIPQRDLAIQIDIASEMHTFLEVPERSSFRSDRTSFAGAFTYSITSSAIAQSLSGIWTPIASAVRRLITSSNLVGCSTGRSAGLAPLKILSMKIATRSKFCALR
jgi:hypothetical protein